MRMAREGEQVDCYQVVRMGQATPWRTTVISVRGHRCMVVDPYKGGEDLVGVHLAACKPVEDKS